MKKFTVSLILSDQDAERMATLWDQVDLQGVLKKALEEYCIERYDAEHYIFKKWGMAIMVNDNWKDKVVGTKLQCQAAKLLSNAEIEEEISEEDK